MIEKAFEEFLTYQRARNTPGTVKFYKQTCGDFHLWLKQNRRKEITPAYVDEYVMALREGWQPAHRLNNHRRARGEHTLAKYRRAIRAFANFAAERNYMEPIKVKVKTPPRPIPHLLTEDDVNTLLSACDRDRDRFVVTLLVDTGIRAAEALKLEWDDVDLKKRRALIREGKGGKYRTIALSETTIDLLKASSNGGGTVLRTRSGKDLTYQGLRKILDRLEARSGVKCNAHCLRRTFATISTKNGMPPFVLQRLLGHSALTTTSWYVGLVDDDLIEGHGKYGPFSNGLKKHISGPADLPGAVRIMEEIK